MDRTETVISARQSLATEFKEFFRSSELLYFFAWRNFKIRYKQTLIGAGWAIFKPFILMIAFTLAFNRIGDITPPNNLPYPIFAYSGLIFWTYFSSTVAQVGDSLVAFQSVVQKIYFPRFIVPTATALTGLIDFLFALIIYVALMLYYGIAPQAQGLLLFVPMLVMSFLSVLGIGLFAAALNVRYRDVSQAMPFLVQVLLFLTPVIYPVQSVPDHLQWILFLNPMAGVIETMRTSLLGLGPVQWEHLGISVASCLVMLLLGIAYFRAKEREFADIL